LIHRATDQAWLHAVKQGQFADAFTFLNELVDQAGTVKLMPKTQLFVSGIPGCGKSTFGRWLAQEKQFTYVDMEHDDLDKYSFRSSWNTFADGKDGASFVSAIQTHPSSVVLDWGFPPRCVHIVQRLKDAGLKMVWFEGDRLSARHHFVARGTVSVSDFDAQYAEISSHWPEIEPIFGDSVVKAAQSDGTLLSPETIFKQVFGENG
jgi:hypothetical protein